MKRYDQPTTVVDPYPSASTKIRQVSFETGLVLLRLKDAVRLRTGEDADYIVGRDYRISWKDDANVQHDIIVPAGLITDLTSVPRMWRWIVGRVGPWLEAAIVHDYLYIAWQDIAGRRPTNGDRRFADQMMLAIMEAANVNFARARLIFWAVRVFGRAGFFDYQQERYIDVCDPDVTDQLAIHPPRPRFEGDDQG